MAVKMVVAQTAEEIRTVLESLQGDGKSPLVLVFPEVDLAKLKVWLALLLGADAELVLDPHFKQFCANLKRDPNAETRALYDRLNTICLQDIQGFIGKKLARLDENARERGDERMETLSDICRLYSRGRLLDEPGISEASAGRILHYLQKECGIELS